MKILIIGGSGGIGQALIKEALQRFEGANIYATYHKNKPQWNLPCLTWLPLDATNENQIFKLSQKITDLDLLINSIGFLHSPSQLPEKSVQQFDVDFFQQNLSLNTLPTLLLAKHFQSAFKNAGNQSRFAVFSARIGSISDNRLGGWVSYRSSKAALNMAIKTISIEWQRTVKNVCLFAFHPGTTDTELSKPFQHNLKPQQLQTAKHTAEAFFDVCGQLTSADSGCFVDYQGNSITW
ncbi:SDR family NAD(P)-dependent oxidoreductase [Parashewanella curva]|uniref:SDR family NAD(P)-dependent oxidoreductase n=1 Tax=Parashewanella curva TaxID=2338552 RepID=A0A3L8PZJ4_9GAMM|nr:SDR family NAD(P)-dependent oxidoreductase [Parashewanella curva]RLV60735.1 SDR family NAD(P)-dependent oxidoreductase [Parashewanella curva]